MREVVRVSELSLWLKCRRRTYLSYELGYDSTSREAGVGTLFHQMVAEYNAPWPLDPDEEVPDLTAEDVVMVQSMFDTYVKEVEAEGLDVSVKTYGVENRIHVEVIPGLSLTGQIDHIYYDTVLDGYVIQDTKTVGQFFQTAPRDFQLMCYAWLAREEYGINVVAIEHNIVKRNKRTGQSKPPYIQRNIQPVTEEALDRFGQSLSYIMTDYQNVMHHVEEAWPEGRGVEDPTIWAKGTNECSWSCPFYDICGMIDDGEDYAAVLETEYHRREAPVDIEA